MLRFLIPLLLLSAALPSAIACEMGISQRAESLTSYVINGRACLNAPPGEFRFDPETERRFLNVVNDERARRGLNRLSLRGDMQPAARFHSLDMGVNGFFGHESPGGRSHAERLAAFDRTLLAEGSAENLAQFGPAMCVDQHGNEVSCALAPGFKPPTRDLVVADLHRKLMNSEGHRRNILDPDMTHIALGVARTDTGFYVTQLFSNVIGALGQPAPLTFEAGHRVDLEAYVPGWTIANLALAQGEAMLDLDFGEIPSGLAGDRGLTVRAETVEEWQEDLGTRTIVTWIYPTGPLIEIVPATGS